MLSGDEKAKRLVDYFLQKKATSPKKAIKLTRAILDGCGFHTPMILHPIIRETPQGLHWLDKQALTTRLERRRFIGMLVFILIIMYLLFLWDSGALF
jgi:hypothetical protein